MSDCQSDCFCQVHGRTASKGDHTIAACFLVCGDCFLYGHLGWIFRRTVKNCQRSIIAQVRDQVGHHAKIDQAFVRAQQRAAYAMHGKDLTELIAGTVVKNGVIHESQVRHSVSRVC